MIEPNTEILKSFTEQRNGKMAVDSFKIFQAYEASLPTKESIKDWLDFFCNLAKKSAKLNFDKAPHSGSINNCRGRWFELIVLSNLVNKLAKKEENCIEILKLPNANNGHYFYQLFVPEQRTKLTKLAPKTSNPDFIAVRSKEKYFKKGTSTLNRYVDTAFFGNIAAEDLIATLSVKTTARPDRRYQQVFEANVIKAMLKKFNVDTQCIVITLEKNDSNEEVYKSPSIESILDESSVPKPSIDHSFVVKTRLDIDAIAHHLSKKEDN